MTLPPTREVRLMSTYHVLLLVLQLARLVFDMIKDKSRPHLPK